MEKFLSRKFLMALASFLMSVGAIVLGDNNELLQLVGAVGVVLAPIVYMVVEAWVDGKAIGYDEYMPTITNAVYDLVQVYEDKYGDSDVTNFIQDLTQVVNKHFVEEDIINEPVGSE